MLWACILFPQLAMDGVLRHRADADSPLALLAGPAQRRVLQAVNPAARAIGLRPGQSLIAAQALSQDFATADYNPVEIEHWQQLLAACAYGFSSQVSLHYPRCLLMEVHSCLSLFGPWPRFEARLREELSALGFRHRITVAPNPAAARILANVHNGLVITDADALRQALDRLPVQHLGFSREAATAFSRMGLRNLARILAQPRDSLSRRFPAEVLVQLDRLLGIRPLALDFHRPPDVFEQRIELNFDVKSHQALLFPLRRLTADLAAYLAGRDSGVQRFVLHLEHRAMADSQVQVGLLRAERDASMLFELTRDRLEQLQLPAQCWPCAWPPAICRVLPLNAASCSMNVRSSPCPGSNCVNACAHAWVMRPYMALVPVPITGPSVPGPLNRPSRNRSRRFVPAGYWRSLNHCARPPCTSLPAPNASNPAGGMATMSAATTTLSRRAAASAAGPFASSAAKAL